MGMFLYAQSWAALSMMAPQPAFNSDEAKDLVDSAPKPIKENGEKEEAGE